MNENDVLNIEDALAMYKDREDVAEIQVYGDDKDGMKEDGSRVILIIEELLAKGINATTNYSGRTALIYASRYGYIEIVRALISRGADSNIQDGYGMTALMHATDFNGVKQEMLKPLLLAGVNILAEDEYGITALMRATDFTEHTKVVKSLIKAGADVNIKDIKCETALMLAAFYGYPDIVKALIKAGADVNAKHDYGRTVLMWATMPGHTEIVQILLKAGSDAGINAQDDYTGATALMEAAMRGSTEILASLIVAGADVNAKTYGDRTALMIAAVMGYTAIVKSLIKAGADVNAKNDGDWIDLPLRPEDLNSGTKRNYGNTALMCATFFGYTEIIELLKNAGAQE